MKKRLIALIVVLALCLTLFSGCNLFTKNDSRVAEQPAVTIGSGEHKQIVTLNEVATTFNSYAPVYIQYFGMTAEQVMNMVIDSLTNTKLMLYHALTTLDTVSSEKGLKAYLTADEIKEAEKTVYESISISIDKLEKEIIKERAETSDATFDSSEARTLPTGASEFTNVPYDFTGSETRNLAYQRLLRNLKSNKTTFDEYFEKSLEGAMNDKIIARFEKELTKDVTVTDQDVQVKYDADLLKEKEIYALAGTSGYAKEFEDGLVLFNPDIEGDGYVLNLLIPYSEEQTKKIKEINDNEDLSDSEKKAEIDKIISQITAKDLRESWLKNYGYVGSTLFEDFAFDGEVKPETIDGVQVRGDDGNFAYETLKLNEYVGIKAILDMVNSHVAGSKSGTRDGFDMYLTKDGKAEEMFQKLIWAYGSDPGALNNEIGYYVPNSSFAEEFSKACDALAKEPVGSYTFVLTDYGYHIIFLREKFDTEGVINVYNPSEKNTHGTFSYDYYQSTLETIKENHINEEMSKVVASSKDIIKVDEKVLGELLG